MAHFPGAAPFFSYMAPGEAIAVHDPGHGKDGSRIKHLGEDLYRYTIDTRRMRGGDGWWYFYNESNDPDQLRAKLGRFTVRKAPRALIDKTTSEPGGVIAYEDNYLMGIDVLGAQSENKGDAGGGRKLWWLVGGIAIGFLLA